MISEKADLSEEDIDRFLESTQVMTSAAASGRNSLVKRSVDIFGALVAIILFFPMGLFIAIAIRLDSKGPIFFVQQRLGRDGRMFPMIKFRSMLVDSDHKLEEALADCDNANEEFQKYRKLKKDPRITRVGRILRKYSLDEIPQFLNVLSGAMSLVGPRPYLPVERQIMKGHDNSILYMRPGLTGLWQVSGRNDLPFAERVVLDVEYIREWSWSNDLRIAMKTIGVVFQGGGSS